MPKFVTLLLCFYGILHTCLAQQQVADSLRKEVQQHTTEDTLKVDLISALAFAYQYIHPDTMTAIAFQGKALADKLNYTTGKADAIKNIAIANYLRGEYTQALENCAQALALYESTGNKKGAGAVINNMAIVYYNQNKYGLALENYRKSLALREEVNDIRGIAACYNNMGNVYIELGKYSESIENFLKGLSIREQLKDEQGIAISLANIANVYHILEKYDKGLEYNLKSLAINQRIGNAYGEVQNRINAGAAYYSLKQYDKAAESFKKGLDLARKLSDLVTLMDCQSNLAQVYIDLKRYPEAEALYTETLQHAKDMGDPGYQATCYLGFGNIAAAHKNYKESLPYLKKSLDLALITGQKRLIIEILTALSETSKSAQDYKAAHAYLLLHNAYKDSAFNESSNKKIQELQFDYELDKQQQLIALLEKDKALQTEKNTQQQLISVALAVGIVFSSVIIFLLYRSRKKEKLAKNLIVEQKEEIQTQADRLEELNQLKDKTFTVLSHDLRSPISALSTLMMMMDEQLITPEEFFRMREDMNRQLGSLSLLLENLLHWSKNQMTGKSYIPVPALLDLQAITARNQELLRETATQKSIRLRNQVPANTCVLADADQLDIVIRNLISNAIKFTPEQGEVTVSTSTTGDKITYSIADNGLGMSPEQLGKLFSYGSNFSSYGTRGEKGTGLGLPLCREFIEKNGGTISVTSEPGKGSTFSFTLDHARSDER